MPGDQREEKKEQLGGLWESILSEVHTESRLSDKTVILLGRPGVGKRTLVQALHAHAWPGASADVSSDISPEGHSRAVGLDYGFFGSRDPSETEAAADPDYLCPAATSVLILEDPAFEKVLRSRLTADALKNCAAVICLDLKAPWTMMEDLRQFLELLQRITSDLLQQLPLEEQDQLRGKLSKTVASYQEEGDNAEGSPSGDSALVYNMGLPIVVVVTRADGASALDTQRTLGWSETIEAYLRNECLSYGAAMVYTMVQGKNVRNVDVLYQYLMHRLYAYALKAKPQVPSRDALFIPSGWDSQTKVDQAAAQLAGGGGLERSFESVVVPMEAASPAPPPLDECEDMQHFLKRNMAVLQKLGGVSAASQRRAAPGIPADAGAAAGAERAKEASSRRSTAKDGGGGAALPGAAGPGGGGLPTATDNASLANFFQNLLTRGQGEGGRNSTTSILSGAPKAAAAAAPAAAAPGGAAPPAAAAGDAGGAAMVPAKSSLASSAAAAGGAGGDAIAKKPSVKIKVDDGPPAAAPTVSHKPSVTIKVPPPSSQEDGA